LEKYSWGLRNVHPFFKYCSWYCKQIFTIFEKLFMIWKNCSWFLKIFMVFKKCSWYVNFLHDFLKYIHDFFEKMCMVSKFCSRFEKCWQFLKGSVFKK
jgi:hypothetical protein